MPSHRQRRRKSWLRAIVCEDFLDAKRVLGVLGKRLARYGLTLHPDKTRFVDFRNNRPNGTVTVAPKGMGLNDFVAHQEGFFAAEGLEVEFDWKTFRGTETSWKVFEYFQATPD